MNQSYISNINKDQANSTIGDKSEIDFKEDIKIIQQKIDKIYDFY